MVRTKGSTVTCDPLQARLASAWSLNRPGGSVEHVVVAIPSISLAPSVLRHYAARLHALEHRYLVDILMLARVRSCHLIFVCSRRPQPCLIEYYAELIGEPSVLERLHLVVVPDETPRPMAAKLLERPQVLNDVSTLIAGRPAYVDPWNVTDQEVDVASRLGLPVFGTPPRLWRLGFKSAGRELLTQVGVPVPEGVADLRGVDEVALAVEELRARIPGAPGVVVKHDDSGAGDGNAVIRLVTEGGRHRRAEEIRAELEELPEWFRGDLRHGGVVEELVCGDRVTSPSVQLEITPTGDIEVLSTHEQVLGGDNGQVYLGCRFPADPEYAAVLARHARAVGAELAWMGACGRIGVDFIVGRSGGQTRVLALEVNLRKGGTTHPFTVLSNLVPGRYEEHSGRWLADDGAPRYYTATDNLRRDAWHGLDPARAITAVEHAGLAFEPSSGTGVVLHMLSCLAVDGRLGLVAIATSSAEADALVVAAEEAIDSCLAVVSSGGG